MFFSIHKSSLPPLRGKDLPSESLGPSVRSPDELLVIRERCPGLRKRNPGYATAPTSDAGRIL
jgi:hypothetical protein